MMTETLSKKANKHMSKNVKVSFSVLSSFVTHFSAPPVWLFQEKIQGLPKGGRGRVKYPDSHPPSGPTN